MKKRNGEIDILRFCFASLIVFAHLNDVFRFGAFSRGHIGVEFFFLVTGYFMARSADRKRDAIPSIANQTWSYLLKKADLYIYIYELAIVLQLFFAYILTGKLGLSQLPKRLLTLFPDITLTMMVLTPANGWFISGAWYLGCMNIVVLLIYPLLLYKFDYVSKLFCPLIGCFAIGYIYNEIGYIEGVDFWTGCMSMGVLRALGEMCLGIHCIIFPQNFALFLKARETL